MLLTLQTSIHSDIFKIMHHFTSEMTCMRERVTIIENKMGEVTSSFNTLVDAQSEGAEDIE